MAFTRLVLVACVATLLCVPEQPAGMPTNGHPADKHADATAQAAGRTPAATHHYETSPKDAEAVATSKEEYYCFSGDLQHSFLDIRVTSTSIFVGIKPGDGIPKGDFYCFSFMNLTVDGVAMDSDFFYKCTPTGPSPGLHMSNLVPRLRLAVRAFAMTSDGNSTAVSNEIIVETLDEQQSSSKSDSNHSLFDVKDLLNTVQLKVNTTSSSIQVAIKYPPGLILRSNEAYCVRFYIYSGEGIPFKSADKCAFGAVKPLSLTGLPSSAKIGLVPYIKKTNHGYRRISSEVEVETPLGCASEKEEPSILNKDVLHESISHYLGRKYPFYGEHFTIKRAPGTLDVSGSYATFKIMLPDDVLRNVDRFCLVLKSSTRPDSKLPLLMNIKCNRPPHHYVTAWWWMPKSGYTVEAIYITKDSKDKNFHASTAKPSTLSHDGDMQQKPGMADGSDKQ